MNERYQEGNFEITETPSAHDLLFLTDKINDETPDQGSASAFAIFLRDSEHRIMAGCNGSIVYGSIYTDQLWVDPKYRKMGIGKRLMEQVHDYGRKKGCTLSTVATMDFQAPYFYHALGYKIDFTRKGYYKEAICLFLSKCL